MQRLSHCEWPAPPAWRKHSPQEAQLQLAMGRELVQGPTQHTPGKGRAGLGPRLPTDSVVTHMLALAR